MNPDSPLEIARRLAAQLYCSDAGASPETQAALANMDSKAFEEFKCYFIVIMRDYCPNRHEFIQDLLRRRFSEADRLVLFSGVGELKRVHAWMESFAWTRSTLWLATSAAARGGHYELVCYFKSKGRFDADLTLSDGAKCGSLALVELALKSGATRLHPAAVNAAVCGHLEILSYLLHRMTEPRLKYILRAASAFDHPEIVSFLLDQGAPVSQTSVERAVYNGRLANIRLLLSKRSVDLNLNSSLVDAAKNDQVEILQLLLEHGAQGLDVALKAATWNNSFRARQLLLDRGAVEKRSLGFSLMDASEYISGDGDSSEYISGDVDASEYIGGDVDASEYISGDGDASEYVGGDGDASEYISVDGDDF